MSLKSICNRENWTSLTSLFQFRLLGLFLHFYNGFCSFYYGVCLYFDVFVREIESKIYFTTDPYYVHK